MSTTRWWRGAMLSVGLAAGSAQLAQADGLVELASVDEFGRRFDADAGRVRLVLLLSPT